MYITTGNINSLVRWFNRNDKTKILCLLVAGRLNDAKFVTEIFKNREALDIISAEDIAIFLFADDQDGTIAVRDFGYTVEVLPGQLVFPRDSELDLLWYKPINAIREEEIRANVITASQSVANDICQHFKLAREDIPCILLLAKGDPVPFIIPTRGEADVKVFYNLLNDLRKITATLPEIYDLDWPMQVIRPLVLEEQKARAKKSAGESEAELQSALTDMIGELERHGLPYGVGRELFNLQTADRVWETIGLRKDLPQPSLAISYSEVWKSALEKGDLKARAREVIRLARGVSQAKKRLEKSEKRIRELESMVTRFDMISAKLVTARDAIRGLCERFEGKFVWKSRYRPVREFAEKILGISGRTNEVLSLQDAIRKLIKL